MKTEKSYAFWPYDIFPYVIGSVIDTEVTVINGKANAYSPSYMGRVNVLHQESSDEGSAIDSALNALNESYIAEQKLLHEKYKKLALGVAPFLSNFPAYKNK